MTGLNLDAFEASNFRARLLALLEASRNELPTFYRTASPVKARQLEDDRQAGRTHLVVINAAARRGLEKLEKGDIAGADQCLAEAERSASDLFVILMQGAQSKKLRTGANPRQRPREKDDRNLRLATAVKVQERKGLKGKAARNAAINSDDSLKADFLNLSDKTIRDALCAGRTMLAD